jgi:hypothetical protein
MVPNSAMSVRYQGFSIAAARSRIRKWHDNNPPSHAIPRRRSAPYTFRVRHPARILFQAQVAYGIWRGRLDSGPLLDVVHVTHRTLLSLYEVGCLRKGAPRRKGRPPETPSPVHYFRLTHCKLLGLRLPSKRRSPSGEGAACCHEAARYVAIASLFQEFLDNAL